MPTIPDNAKQYGLKQNEIRVINNYNDLANQMMASFVSFIAIERLAYTPTENTQFSVEGDKIFIWENEPQAEEPPKNEEEKDER